MFQNFHLVAKKNSLICSIKANIYRYDGRGHLQDLIGYDADRSNKGWDYLTEEEKKMKVLLDEERYRDLKADIQEKLFYEGYN